MGIFDDVKKEAIDKNLINGPNMVESPSLSEGIISGDPSVLTNTPEEKLSTDVSPDIYKNGNEDDENPTNVLFDNRTGMSQGRLIHNWWVEYLKSLKKFIGDSFDDSINTYEFNFSNKSILLKKLYEGVDFQNPSCIISMDTIRLDSNVDPIRRNSGFFNMKEAATIAVNNTIGQLIKVDFKSIVASQSITLNFTNSTDVLNFLDRIHTIYPQNKDFVSYRYRSYINVHEQTEDWLPEHDVENITIDTTATQDNDKAGRNAWEEYMMPQRWGEYMVEPLFTLSSVSPSIDKTTEKYQIQISLETRLMVPSTILKTDINFQNIKAIEVVIDVADSPTDDKGNELRKISSLDKPITIDINRGIYSTEKYHSAIYLNNLNIDTTRGKLMLPSTFKDNINGMAASVYIIKDSTVTDPELFWYEVGFLFESNNLDDPLLKEYHNEWYLSSYTPREYLEITGKDESVFDDLEIEIESTEKLEFIEMDVGNLEELSEVMSATGPWFSSRLLLYKMV